MANYHATQEAKDRLLLATAKAVEVLLKSNNEFHGEFYPEQEELSDALEAVETNEA